MKRLTLSPSLLLAVALMSASFSFAQDQSSASRPAPPTPSSLQNQGRTQAAVGGKVASPAEKYFSDVELINQDGQKMRFYSDVLKGKVVIINTFFATCTSVCPPMSRNFEKIQEFLGDRLGKDAFLVSISVDPEMDKPTRLKEYGRKFHARPGWIFLTGKKENLDWALYKLGQYVEKKDDHSTIVIIGNEPTGLWKKAFGLAQASELIKVVEDVLNDR